MELVRAAVEAYQRPEMVAALASGDLDFEMFDPDIEWDASRLREMIPDLAGIYRGHEGVRTYWRSAMRRSLTMCECVRLAAGD